MDFIKVLFRTNNRTGCRFLIVDALNRPETLHYYEKNGFRYQSITTNKNPPTARGRRCSKTVKQNNRNYEY
jgi:hypothetical protein